MLLIIVLLPLVGFFSGSLFGHLLGYGVCYITTFCIFLSFCLSLTLFFNILSTACIYKTVLGNWVCVDSLNIDWSLLVDSLTVIMLLVVTFISTLVHLYSIEYMEHDPHLLRFMAYLSLFSFFMLILVTSGNFLQMFVGWEGVGLASYLLINFWFTRIQANKAAVKAMLVNRIGDFFILLALFLIYFFFETLDYEIVFSIAPILVDYKFQFFSLFNFFVLDIICICLFLGAMGKSAQLGLHTWLPDAMEGPTPVSALIHAATMVTAGVFLIVRCSFLFELSPISLNIIMIIGASTAFFASTTGLFQNDMKKVIAYSTCSQLGYMIFACGLSSYEIGIFHLSNHAFFKALLFLGAGSVIHAISDEQDMRRMGGLKNLLPLSYSTMLVGSLALVGFPFLTGFYSKDTILEAAFAKYSTLGHYCYFLGTVSAFFTAFYSTRLLFLVFLSSPNGYRKFLLTAHEGTWKLSFPLFLLSFFSISIGFLTKEIFIGVGTDFWSTSILITNKNYLLHDVEFLPLFYKQLPLLLTLLGIFLAYYLYSFEMFSYFSIKQKYFFKKLYTFLNRKWYFDRVYNQFISQNILYNSYFLTYKDMDRGAIEIIGPSGISHLTYATISKLQNFQSGNIFHYLLIFFSTMFLLILIVFIFSNISLVLFSLIFIGLLSFIF